MNTAVTTIRVPGSKSITHRAYLLAAQSSEPCTVVDPLRSADTDATLGCLHRLGHRFQIEERGVRFLPSLATPPMEPLDCHNAGTTLRLMLAAVARQPFPVQFTGDESLQRRPNAPLLDALRNLGASVTGHDTLPLTIRGPIHSGLVQLPAGVSSQYASALLMALAQVPGRSELILAAPVSSAPYIELTIRVAEAFGLTIETTPGGYSLLGGQVPRAPMYRVEGDWSTAAFPLVAAAITGTSVRVAGLDPESVQGDRRIMDHLAAFGCTVKATDDGVEITGGPLQTPGTIDVSATPDMFPALAIVAACATGQTTFTGGESLRHKESDRIAAMAHGLTELGIQAEPTDDGMRVTGGTLRGGSVASHDDHRIHMAFAVAGLVADGKVQVDGPESVAVSYPNFHADLARIAEAA